jgi:hypothetical protein
MVMERWIDQETKGKIPYKLGERMKPYSKKKSYYLCPECGLPVRFQCMCPIMDSVCENGHKWHIEYKDKQCFVTKGEGDHSRGGRK